MYDCLLAWLHLEQLCECSVWRAVLMMKVFLESSISRDSLISLGHIVLTFYLANYNAAMFFSLWLVKETSGRLLDFPYAPRAQFICEAMTYKIQRPTFYIFCSAMYVLSYILSYYKLMCHIHNTNPSAAVQGEVQTPLCVIQLLYFGSKRH